MRCNPFSNGAEADYARPAMPSKYTPGDFDLVVRRASAGLGLFAESPIPKGACVIEYWGRPLTPEESALLDELRAGGGAPDG